MTNTIPLPRPSALTAPFWDGCRQGELRVQRCCDCGHYVFIPQLACPDCGTRHLDWVVSAGRGHVYSYTTVHRPQRPAFPVPYVAAIIALTEGWHMLSNIVDCEIDRIHTGMPVAVCFRRMSAEITLPLFTPVTTVAPG